jgi:hypothetical protein
VLDNYFEIVRIYDNRFSSRGLILNAETGGSNRLNHISFVTQDDNLAIHDGENTILIHNAETFLNTLRSTEKKMKCRLFE